jgi:two-component system sensor histidine kinase DegS
MYDNNPINENDNIIGETPDDRKNCCILLKDMAVDFEEKLYDIKTQMNQQINLLKQKELELNESERTQDHNLDLFSPISNRINDTSEIIDSIAHIKLRINELNQELQKYNNKIAGLKSAAEYIEKIDINMKSDQNSDIHNSFNDIGLSILEAQEVERQRIARDLHDTTVQNLTSLVHKSELCAKLIDIDAIRAKLELNAMSNTLKMVINDMRGIIYNLKPMTLDDLGLTITVQRYANRIMNLSNIEVIVTNNEEVKNILSVIKLTVFRIIQEACNNVIKHANASLINIDINYEKDSLSVSIKDDGVGFNMECMNTNTSVQSSSFGLSIMKERISLLSGTLDVNSEKNKGTIVTIYVPLTAHEEER